VPEPSPPLDLASGTPLAKRLSAWMQDQRWFASKSRALTELQIVDLVGVPDPHSPLMILIAQADFRSGPPELYQLPLVTRADSIPPDREAIARIDDHTQLLDALIDPAACTQLVSAFASNSVITGRAGQLSFHRPDPDRNVPADATARAMGAEQSNSSIVFDERLVLKIFRRIEPGTNPEVEMTRFLTEHGFTGVADLAGHYEYTGGALEATLGALQEYVADARDGWTLALSAISADDETFLTRLGELGVATAQMHNTLASDSVDPAFAPEPAPPDITDRLRSGLRQQIDTTFANLPDTALLRALKDCERELRSRTDRLPALEDGGQLLRIHGDYHLGQTIHAGRRWTILDFEGEPDRPLHERRRKESPLRDVAGMLRSFAYADASARQPSDAASAGWERAARRQFLDGYLRAINPALLPPQPGSLSRLLTLFELHRAVYELRYELDHRPDWIHVPLAGITALMEDTAAVGRR